MREGLKSSAVTFSASGARRRGFKRHVAEPRRRAKDSRRTSHQGSAIELRDLSSIRLHDAAAVFEGDVACAQWAALRDRRATQGLEEAMCATQRTRQKRPALLLAMSAAY